jgi:hypothetical protein
MDMDTKRSELARDGFSADILLLAVIQSKQYCNCSGLDCKEWIYPRNITCRHATPHPSWRMCGNELLDPPDDRP